MHDGLRGGGDPHGGGGLDKFSVLEEIGAAKGGMAHNLRPVVETVFP